MRSRVARATATMMVIPLALLVSGVAMSHVFAQEGRSEAPLVITAADYARAESFLAPSLTDSVVGGTVTPAWLPDERFTYRSTSASGSVFLLVDPVKRTREPAFDHTKLAAALSAATGRAFTERQLPFQAIERSPDGKMVAFDIEARRWSCDTQGTRCAVAGEALGGQRTGGRGAGGGRVGAGAAVPTSPDGRRVAFIRDWNPWVRDVATNQERPLTADGVPNFGYATERRTRTSI